MAEDNNVVLVLTAEEYRQVMRALGKAVSTGVAFFDQTPYPDDHRWSPWSRWGKPMAERCDLARQTLRAAAARYEGS